MQWKIQCNGKRKLKEFLFYNGHLFSIEYVVKTLSLRMLEYHEQSLAEWRAMHLAIWKFKGDSRYTGSDNEDDVFNDFTMNRGFIQYNFQ